jgi:hypothetical protein
MSQIAAVIKGSPKSYTRKKDGKIGSVVTATLDNGDDVPLFGGENDPLIMSRYEGEIVMLVKSGNFYNIDAIINSDGEMVNPNEIKATPPDNEEIKKYIRFQAKILDYCLEQNSSHGVILYQQACKKFNL